jgi:hypothetical protein
MEAIFCSFCIMAGRWYVWVNFDEVWLCCVEHFTFIGVKDMLMYINFDICHILVIYQDLLIVQFFFHSLKLTHVQPQQDNQAPLLDILHGSFRLILFLHVQEIQSDFY